MKAEQVTASFFARAGSGEAQVIHGLEKDQWLNTITAGQILKGRVLREYSDSRYGVSFNGQERIVDSTIPLAKGDLLSGKVLNVNERNVSIKLLSHNAAQKNENQVQSSTFKNLSGADTPLDINANALNIHLNASQKNAINNASNQTNSALAINIGLYLVKLGLPVQADLIRLLVDRVQDKANFAAHDLDQIIPMLSFQGGDYANGSELHAIETLKRYFMQEVDSQDSQHTTADEASNSLTDSAPLVARVDKHNANADGEQQDDWRQLQNMLMRLLNINTEGLVQHKLSTLPLIVDGQLHEFDVAIFDHAQGEHNQTALSSKRLKFALDTQFGLVNLDVNIVNNRLRVSMTAENQSFLDSAESFADDLVQQLTETGWLVDALSYQKKTYSVNETAVHEVIKSVLQQDSLNIEA